MEDIYDIDTIGERNTGGRKSAVMKKLVTIKSGVMIVIENKLSLSAD